MRSARTARTAQTRCCSPFRDWPSERPMRQCRELRALRQLGTCHRKAEEAAAPRRAATCPTSLPYGASAAPRCSPQPEPPARARCALVDDQNSSADGCGQHPGAQRLIGAYMGSVELARRACDDLVGMSKSFESRKVLRRRGKGCVKQVMEKTAI